MRSFLAKFGRVFTLITLAMLGAGILAAVGGASILALTVGRPWLAASIGALDIALLTLGILLAEELERRGWLK